MIETVGTSGPFGTIYSLAKRLHRYYPNVYNDVKKLEQARLLARIQDGPAKGQCWLTFRAVEAALQQGVDPEILLRVNRSSQGGETRRHTDLREFSDLRQLYDLRDLGEAEQIDYLCSFVACDPEWNGISKGELVVAMLVMMEKEEWIRQHFREYVKKERRTGRYGVPP